ncbi:unnamed protein product [Acanthoscelides obtectus]|uniref:DDE Tnp4 domain-containing protein n=1 Tax=Acanthoscelides obtectus TaxID=200917 RepID=A0A9P0PES3_ACAOB|nr:unnamed protein product [Acanthoscelides obtectus]CAK1681437.1 hypothetical protein AOBTE_LOCUS33136 [Acanthoscelides obtectus]
MKVPSSEKEWKKVIQGFSARWNLPNCAGALDGKRSEVLSIQVQNFTTTRGHSVLALVDDQYCFQYIDVGANGRASDGGVFSKSSLNSAIENNLLKLPPNAVFVADDAFPLKEYLLKPYSHTHTLNTKRKDF